FGCFGDDIDHTRLRRGDWLLFIDGGRYGINWIDGRRAWLLFFVDRGENRNPGATGLVQTTTDLGAADLQITDLEQLVAAFDLQPLIDNFLRCNQTSGRAVGYAGRLAGLDDRLGALSKLSRLGDVKHGFGCVRLGAQVQAYRGALVHDQIPSDGGMGGQEFEVTGS